MTLARFGSAAQGNPLYEAGVQLGRLLRTAFLADYFVNDTFRNELRRVLNRGEVKRAIGQHGDGLEYLTNAGSPGSLVEPPPRHSTGIDWKDCPTRLENINLRGVFRFPVDRYADQILVIALKTRDPEPPHVSTQLRPCAHWQKSQAIDDGASACTLAHDAWIWIAAGFAGMIQRR